jgi:hypothetical protein
LNKRSERNEAREAREAASLERGAAISEHAKASADSYSPMDWSLAQNNNLAAVSAVAQHGGYMIGAGGVREGTNDAGPSASPASSSEAAAGTAPGNAALPASLDAMLGSAFPSLRGMAGMPGASTSSSGASPGIANSTGDDPGPFRFAGLPGDGLTGRVLGSYDTSARQLVSQLPPGSAGPVAEQLSLLRHSVARSSILQEAGMLGQQRQAAFTDAVQGIARNVAAQPETLDTQLQFIETHMIDVGPGQETFRAQMRATVIDAGVKAQINRDPRGMLLALEHRAGANDGAGDGGALRDNAGSAEGGPSASPEDHLAEHPVTQAITPAEARQYLGQARAAVAIAQSNERAAAAQGSDAAMRSYLATGSAAQAPSEAQLIGAFGLEEGQRQYARLLEAQSEGRQYVNYRALPTATLREMQSASTNVPMPDSSVSDTSGAGLAQRAVARVLKTRESDPIAAALEAGGHGISPLDLSGPEAVFQNLAGRVASSREVLRDYGAAHMLLSDSESAKLAKVIDSLQPEQQSIWLQQFTNAIGDPDLIKNTLVQLSRHSNLVALASMHQVDEEQRADASTELSLQSASTESKSVTPSAPMRLGGDGRVNAPELILRGRALLSEEGGLRMPPDSESRRDFNLLFGNLLADYPGANTMLYDGARAIYAMLSERDGDGSGVLNASRWIRAVQLSVLGSVTERELDIDMTKMQREIGAGGVYIDRPGESGDVESEEEAFMADGINAHPSHDPHVNGKKDTSDPSSMSIVADEEMEKSGIQRFKVGEHIAIGRSAVLSASKNLGLEGMDALSADERARLYDGLVWPDAPTDAKANPRSANLGTFALRYLMAEHLPKKMVDFLVRWGASDLEVTRQSHFGYLQSMHAMGDDPNETNRQVQEKIVGRLVHWYRLALTSQRDGPHYIGRMGHTIADSFAGGHTSRGNDGIEQFQNYNDQDHDKHSEADQQAQKVMAGDGRYQDFAEIPGIKESIGNLAELIVMYKNKVEPEKVEQWLKTNVFGLNPAFADRLSGGSAPEYAKPGARIIYPGKP